VCLGRADNGIPVDVSPERSSGSLHRRVAQLPRDLVVHLAGVHHHRHRTWTDLHTQAFLYGQTRPRPIYCYSHQRYHLHWRTTSYAPLDTCSGVTWVTKIQGQEVAIFRQISDTGDFGRLEVQILQNGEGSAPNFAFLEKHLTSTK